MVEITDKLIYKGAEFIFDACMDVTSVARKLEIAGECPGIMNSAYEKKVQKDGSAVYKFVGGEDASKV